MKQRADHTVSVVARGEGLEYVDAGGTYRFSARLKRREWTVTVPPTKGGGSLPFELHHLTDVERARILPRIESYLSSLKLFGIFPMSYTVRFARELYDGHDFVGFGYSRQARYRTVMTRDTEGSYRLYLQRWDGAKDARGVFQLEHPSWHVEDTRTADSWDRAEALATEMLASTPDGVFTKGDAS